MKTTIICPTDFTDAANNATEYAAKLAQVLDAELKLFNVQRINFETAAISLGEGIAKDARENAYLASNKLKQISLEINKLYQIPTTYEVDITTKSITQTISSAGSKHTMIVMGTNGAENLTQFFFGTNTYNVSRKAKHPILIVPDNLSFEKYKNVLYPVIIGKTEPNALGQFNTFAKFFDAQITFLLVAQGDTKTKTKEFNQIKEEIEYFFNGKLKPDIKSVFTDNIDDTIDEYIHENQTDLVVMEEPHTNVLGRLFHKRTLLATISAIAPYPILVVHPE